MTGSGRAAQADGKGASAAAAAYRARAGHFDEVIDERGQLRPHWQAFVSRSRAFEREAMEHAQSQAARSIRDNGVTYNVYGDARPRAWSLDALPFLLDAVEWERLAGGLRQRARLLEAVAHDIYGEQRLLRDGLLPPALVLGHPGFARCCHGAAAARGPRLMQLAFDLGRGPDGCWRVIGTRVQSPSGAGYALENRVTVSRIFPDTFRDLHVHMLARFFAQLRDSIRQAANGAVDRGHIVLMTPGPLSETYFEHAYLARYLGFALAEGGDLTVRNERVYLLTLSGLEPVAAVLRRMDDDYCDPLELHPESALGVPGLVSAWRSGNVAMANAIGAAVLESPGLYGFLPPIAHALFGEELLLPSVATWWAGEAAALRAAAERRGMMLKPAFALPLQARASRESAEPVFLDDVRDEEREAALQAARRHPERFVLQEYVPLSHVPVWSDGRLESRAMMLRVFLTADGRGDYTVMPGGLARIAGTDDRVVSGQRGGGSKDVWVMSDGPVERYSLLASPAAAAAPASFRRGLSSRAAENLFWFGRYTERAEGRARLLRAVLTRLLDVETFPAHLYGPLLACCRRYGILDDAEEFSAVFLRRGEPSSTSLVRLERRLTAVAFEKDSGAGMTHDLAAARRAASAVRDHLSLDSWRLISEVSLLFENARAAAFADVLSKLDRTVVTLAAIAGLETERMMRDDAWRIVALGRNIERILSLSVSLSEVRASGDRDHPALLDWLLDLSDVSVTYRAIHRRAPEWTAVCELLVFEDANPRSAGYLLAKLTEHARKLPGATFEGLAGPVLSALEDARQTRSDSPLVAVAAVERLLEAAAGFATGLSDALARRYFRHIGEATHSSVGG